MIILTSTQQANLYSLALHYREFLAKDTVYCYLKDCTPFKTGEECYTDGTRLRLISIGSDTVTDINNIVYPLSNVQSFNLGYAR